jgi:hypothetical protein
MRTALLIAYHFPPYSGSSGIQRTLKFARYLPEFGWQPIVLSTSVGAYPSTSADLLAQIPPGVVVRRAFALDSGRHLAVRGRYLRFSALPDRWVSWWPTGVRAGLDLVRRHRPAVIFATYPIATAHLIGATLARLTGLPLVADYRDAMVVDDFPEDRWVRRAYRAIESRVMRTVAAAVFTTPRSRQLYVERYPAVAQERLHCIRNGYDEPDFSSLPEAGPRPAGERLRLLHSGLLKLSERDPRPFLGALSDLIRDGALPADSLEVIFRAPGDEEGHRRLVADFGLEGVVLVRPPVPYAQALQEMAAADVLLTFQDAQCNHLVPAKLYEYIRVRRPVLALTDEGGETADLVREAGAGIVLDLTSRERIRAALPRFLSQVLEGSAPVATISQVQKYSRRSQTGELAAILENVAATGPRA